MLAFGEHSKRPVIQLVSQAFFPLEPNDKHMQYWSHGYAGSSLSKQAKTNIKADTVRPVVIVKVIACLSVECYLFFLGNLHVLPNAHLLSSRKKLFAY